MGGAKKHNKIPKQLLAVFPCSVNAQFYAKNHKGFQKKFAPTTDMLEDGYTQGVMQPLKAAYHKALAQRSHAASTPGSPEHRQQTKRSRIRSPFGSAQRNVASSASSPSTLSSHGIPPHHDPFFTQPSNTRLEDWQFDHMDPSTVSHIVGLCPPENMEQLRIFMSIATEPDMALSQVMAWRKQSSNNQNV
jgi:hypothetical protein